MVKKLVLALILGFLIGSVIVFVLIPGTLTVISLRTIASSMPGTYRFLANDSSWKYKLNCEGTNLTISRKIPSALQISNATPLTEEVTTLLLLQAHPDSTRLKWETRYEAGLDPFQRIINYRKAVKFKSCMNSILASVNDYLQHNEDLYGFRISRTTLTDTFLVAVRFETQNYPETEMIYSRIDKIKKYIAASGAREMNDPILNITTNENGSKTVTVGIATSRELNDSGIFVTKRLAQYKNRTLTTLVTGDHKEVEEGLKAIHQYMDDYHMTSPTVHFELLITDRRKEKDASKWVTRIFYPIV
ncbi:MAG TPA: hypothetical protein VK666_09620 [Chryseolinea sp.]|nr:hypothetical protein [Chryseolinea sp.]